MIITRTPFRITLGGGGTDLPSFYEEHGGCVFSMGINKHMYIFLHRLPVTHRNSIIRYSQVEHVSSLADIQHPLAREALKLHDIRDHIELTSMADLPARTGLGSSGAYLVGLLTALDTYTRTSATQQDIAEQACHIEMNILNEPVGKQDQYMASFGGFRVLNIGRDGVVDVEEVPVDLTTAGELVMKARMYYTGVQRSATSILKAQDDAAREVDSADHSRVVDCLCQIKEIGFKIRKAFEDRDLDTFGKLMDEHWSYKKQMSARIGLSALEELYDEVKKRFGVLGGKIIGAGGGGFVLLYCPERIRELDAYMASKGMPQVDIFPEFQGAKVITDFSE
jgi:D-glycero-alpha-D-manno-heptose-7-phosphate kinase